MEIVLMPVHQKRKFVLKQEGSIATAGFVLVTEPGPLKYYLDEYLAQAGRFPAVFEDRHIEDDDFMLVGGLLGRKTVFAAAEETPQRIVGELAGHAGPGGQNVAPGPGVLIWPDA
jgi:hypothetical protein